MGDPDNYKELVMRNLGNCSDCGSNPCECGARPASALVGEAEATARDLERMRPMLSNSIHPDADTDAIYRAASLLRMLANDVDVAREALRAGTRCSYLNGWNAAIAEAHRELLKVADEMRAAHSIPFGPTACAARVERLKAPL